MQVQIEGCSWEKLQVSSKYQLVGGGDGCLVNGPRGQVVVVAECCCCLKGGNLLVGGCFIVRVNCRVDHGKFE